MAKPTVVVIMSGGSVREIRADSPDVNVEVVDYDAVRGLAGGNREDYAHYLNVRADYLIGLATPVEATEPSQVEISTDRLPHSLY